MSSANYDVMEYRISGAVERRPKKTRRGGLVDPAGSVGLRAGEEGVNHANADDAERASGGEYDERDAGRRIGRRNAVYDARADDNDGDREATVEEGERYPCRDPMD